MFPSLHDCKKCSKELANWSKRRVGRVDGPVRSWRVIVSPQGTPIEPRTNNILVHSEFDTRFLGPLCNDLVNAQIAFGMATLKSRDTWLVYFTLFYVHSFLAQAASPDKAAEKASYAPADAIPVSCLNRTV